jgi:hypothetical protein
MGVGERVLYRKGRRGMHAELHRGSIQQRVSRQNQMIADRCDFSAWVFSAASAINRLGTIRLHAQTFRAGENCNNRLKGKPNAQHCNT